MEKIKILLGVIFCIFAVVTGAHCEAEQAIVTDVYGEVFEAGAEIVVQANCDLEYLDYTLPDPFQIIVDPIGKVYSDLQEEITFDAGPVQKIKIIKGRAEDDATGNFYRLDFITIELSQREEYWIKRKGQEITIHIGRKEKIKLSKLLPELEEKIEEEYPVEPAPLEEEIIEELEIEELPPVEEIELEEELIEEAPPVPEEVEVIPLPPIKVKEEVPVVTELEEEPEPAEVIPLPTPKILEEPPIAFEPSKLVYTIGEGDTLEISVWQHPELDKKVIVRPDGYISFSLIGDVKAAGISPPELSSLIRENLSRLIKDPQVTVIVSGFGSKNVLVLGEVAKPGSYPFKGGTYVLNAISEAGGWKSSAVLSSVMLVRKAFTDATEAHRLDVYALVRRGDFSQNLMLEPGDIIYIPKSFVANIGSFIENLKISVGATITENTTFLD